MTAPVPGKSEARRAPQLFYAGFRPQRIGIARGAVALWIGPGTEGYFTGLEIKPQP